MKRKKIIIYIFACVLIVACAIAIPYLGNKIHIEKLCKTVEVSPYSYSSQVSSLSPQKVINLIYQGQMLDDYYKESNNILERAKNVTQEFFGNIDRESEAKKFFETFIERCNLNYYEEQSIFVQDEYSDFYITIEMVELTQYEGEYELYVNLWYDTTTGTILGMYFNYIDMDTLDESTFNPWLAVLRSAAEKYYEARGVDKESYMILDGGNCVEISTFASSATKAEMIKG